MHNTRLKRAGPAYFDSCVQHPVATAPGSVVLTRRGTTPEPHTFGLDRIPQNSDQEKGGPKGIGPPETDLSSGLLNFGGVDVVASTAGSFGIGQPVIREERPHAAAKRCG